MASSRASFTSYEADFIAVHAFQSDELCSKMVSVKAFLGSVADPTWKETEATAHVTSCTRIWTLKWKIKIYK